MDWKTHRSCICRGFRARVHPSHLECVSSGARWPDAPNKPMFSRPQRRADLKRDTELLREVTETVVLRRIGISVQLTGEPLDGSERELTR